MIPDATMQQIEDLDKKESFNESNRKYKLMFIHIPKTGGMNILTTLKNINQVLSYDNEKNIPHTHLSDVMTGKTGDNPDLGIWKSSKRHNHDVSTRANVKIFNVKAGIFFHV